MSNIQSIAGSFAIVTNSSRHANARECAVVEQTCGATFPRSISASMRQDTEYNAINSYFMVHFVYRLNAFGKGNSRGGFDGPRPGGRGGRGGFGGGRPF